jgi:hypothetical protein
MAPTNPSPKAQESGAESGAGWDEVVRLTAAACVHRSEGRERLAMRILQENLPAAIRAWSSSCGFPAGACKQSLRSMFARVREQVAIASVQRRMAETAVGAGPGGERMPAPGRISLRQRIRIDDVPAMLDALADAEAESATERPFESFRDPCLALSA